MSLLTVNRFLGTALLGAAIVCGGCKTSTDPDSTSVPVPTPPTITSVAGIAPVNSLAVIRVTSVINGAAVDQNTGTAHFGKPGSDKGTVKVSVGTQDFVFTKLVMSDTTYAYTPSAGNPAGIALNAAATPVTFNVTGYPLASATVIVPGQLKLTSPVANAAVPRTGPLTVTWTVSGGAGSQSAIFISDALGHTVFHQNLGAVASGVFTANDLAPLAAGVGYIYGISYTYVLTNSNTAVLIGEACAVQPITLQ